MKPLGHDRIALVVDLETPRPGALDDPAFGEHLEATGVNAVDDFDPDVMVAAVLDEGAFEPRVTPRVNDWAKRAERSRARFATLMPPTLSDGLAATTTAMMSPRVSTMPNVLRR
jgi:hypothetical protein